MKAKSYTDKMSKGKQ